MIRGTTRRGLWTEFSTLEVWGETRELVGKDLVDQWKFNITVLRGGFDKTVTIANQDEL